MTGLLRTERLQGDRRREFVVNVYDDQDALVCFCGPYTLREWRECIYLFADAGWIEVRDSHDYARCGRGAAR